MSRVQQELRESFKKGDSIFVVMTVGNQTKKKPAVVLQALRGAVQVRFQDGRESTIRINEIEHANPPPPKVEEKKRARVEAPSQPPPAPVPVQEERAPVLHAVPDPESVDPAGVRRDLEAWRAMGRELELGLRALNAEILRETKLLNEEKASIEARLEILRKELESNNADLDRLKGR